MQTVTIIQPMTETEARSHVVAINNAAADMGRRLLELKEREGWIVLGYKSWSAMLEGEFSYSRKHLYELMHAAPVLEKLLPVGNNISTKTAAALARFDEDLHPAIVKTTVARYGQLTESNVTRVGTVVQEMSTTGHVDVGNGTSTPIEAALEKEDLEALMRQREYINGKQKPKTNRAGDEAISQGFDRCQTPAYALDPLLPYLQQQWRLWEPAAGDGLLVEALYDSGFKTVHAGDILTGQNFFDVEPPAFDCLITNPPYSIKYQWIEHCYALNKPFALLLPVETLGAKTAQVFFREHGIEVIFMDRRVNFKMPNMGYEGNGAQFPVAWFTWGLNIGQQMVFARLP